MSWTKPDNSLREQDPLGRFEIICEKYLDGNSQILETILSAIDEKDRHQFLIGCGLYHIFRDQRLYKAVMNAVGEQIYRDAHPEWKGREE